MKKAPAKSGDEQDIVTSWRKEYTFTKRPGVCAKVKRAIRRRQRHDKSWRDE